MTDADIAALATLSTTLDDPDDDRELTPTDADLPDRADLSDATLTCPIATIGWPFRPRRRC